MQKIIVTPSQKIHLKQELSLVYQYYCYLFPNYLVHTGTRVSFKVIRSL